MILTGDQMKDMSQRAQQTPEEPMTEDDRTGNTLKRVSLALLHEIASDERERGSDPYNSTDGKAQADLWSRQRGRR